MRLKRTRDAQVVLIIANHGLNQEQFLLKASLDITVLLLMLIFGITTQMIHLVGLSMLPMIFHPYMVMKRRHIILNILPHHYLNIKKIYYNNSYG